MKFTRCYRALRLAVDKQAPVAEVEAAYREADAELDGAGMPGLRDGDGLLPLALLCVRVTRGLPAPVDANIDWGPYGPWTRPLVLLGNGCRDDAAAALAAVPDPPCDLTTDALWCRIAQAALTLADRVAMERAQRALAPAGEELAGAGTGLLTLHPVSEYLHELAIELR